MTVDTSKLKISTKTLVSALFVFGALMQIPQVNQVVIRLTNAHPHIAAVVTALMCIYALLHTPEVQQALGIKETVTATVEKVTLAPEQPK